MPNRWKCVTATLLLLPLAGCFVSSKKNANGDDNVSISTPLGGMSVKTDSKAVQAKVGLPMYPGAQVLKSDGKKEGSADVDMSFGVFHLRVLALSFTTPDSPDKVRAYYRDALKQYGEVIECQHKKPIGTPVKTGLGLTCNEDSHVSTGKKGDADFGNDANEIELKAGSPGKQHIVAFSPKDGGTKFGLVALELPHGGDDNDKAN